MTAKRLNVGLIGSGFMGQANADAFRRAATLYRDLPAVPHLATIADATPELAAAAAARLGFERSTGDWRRLVEDPAIDVVDITSLDLMHREMALAAVAAGRHVYCENPLAVTLREAEEMAAAARRAGVKTKVAFNNVKTPAAMLARQNIDRGEIGTPMRFRGWFDQGFYNDPDLPHSPRLTRREAGSGYGAVAGADAPRAPVENEDQIQALVRFAGGAGGTIEASRVAAGKVFGVCWEVSGTEGTIVMDGERFNELKVSRFNDPKPDRGFKTILCGSQVPPYGAFFGFDFAGGGSATSTSR